MRELGTTNFDAIESLSDQTTIRKTHLANVSSITLTVLGLSGLIWVLTSWDHYSDDSLSKPCLPLAVSAALIIFGTLVKTTWRKFSFWMAINLIGQAASLQLIDAGRLIHFQHFRSFAILIANYPLPLAFLAVQVIFVITGVSLKFQQLTSLLRQHLGITRSMLFIGFVVLAGAAVTPDLALYLNSIVFAAVITVIGLLNIFLIVEAVPVDSADRVRRYAKTLYAERLMVSTGKPSLDRFAFSVSLLTVALTALLSYFVYQSHPHIPDETQYLFQAKYMAAGQLTVEPPLVRDGFSMYMVPYLDDHWYSIFPPAYPAVLALGVLLGVVWLVNPLFSGLSILLAYLFFQQLYSRSFARVAIALLACSPWFIFTGMSLMSHAFALACSLGAAVLFLYARNQRGIFPAIGSGFLTGVVSLIRPLDGVILAILLGFWGLCSVGALRSRLKLCIALAFGTLISASLVFPYNKAVSGSWSVLPSDAYYDKYFWPGVMSLGFGPNRGMNWGLDAYPGHSPLEALINTALNTFQLNTELFGWGLGSLALMCFFMLSGRIQKKDLWAVVCIAIVIAAYSLFWYHGGPDFGARYWFITIVPLVALSVRGLETISEKLANADGLDRRFNFPLLCGAAAISFITLLSYLPWRATDKYYHYLEMQPGIEKLAKDYHFGRSLVLVRGAEHPDYQSAWIYNPVNFGGDVPLYAWDKNIDVRSQLLKAYPDRPVWLVDGPTITGNGFQVVRGPLTAVDESEIAFDQ